MAHRTATKAARMVKQLNAVKPPKGRFKRPSAPASATPPEAGGPPPPERPVYATPESRVTQLLGAAKALEGTAHRAAKVGGVWASGRVHALTCLHRSATVCQGAGAGAR